MKKFSRLIAVAGILAVLCGGLQAATYTNAVGGTEGYPSFLGGKVYTLTGQVDLSERTYVASDVVQVLRVPAGTYVSAVGYQWTTACTDTNAATWDIGDGTDPDGYVSNLTTAVTKVATSPGYAVVSTPTVTLSRVTTNFLDEASETNLFSVVTNVTVTVASTATASPPYTDGKLYTAADTIDVTFDATPIPNGTGILKVWALAFDLN